MANYYDVTIITVRPGMHPQALEVLKDDLAKDADLRACWYSDIGALNQVFIISRAPGAEKALVDRLARTNTDNPFGLGEIITGITMDTYVSLDFMAPLEPGEFGPYYEVRTYMLNMGGLPPTIELWRGSVPKRAKLSPLLAAMVSVTGAVTRFLHIWPYKSLDERSRLRAKTVADGVWPPPGGPGHLATMQSDIYLPASFSPIR